MQIGRQGRSHYRGGMRPLSDITAEPVGDEVIETPSCLGVAAAKIPNRRNALVDAQIGQESGDIGEIDVAGDAELAGEYMRTIVGEWAQEFVAQPQQLGTQGSRGDLRFGRDQLDRNDDIALDLQNAAPRCGGNFTAPLLLRPQIAAIANHDRRPLCKFDSGFSRTASAYDKAQPPRLQCLFGLGETLEHEGVVTCICLGVVLSQSIAD